MKCYTDEYIKKYYDLGIWDDKIWNDYITEHAKNTPDKEAAVDQPNKEDIMGIKPMRLTWGEFKKLVDRLALNFIEFGIKPEDVVMLEMPNCIELILAEMAVEAVGAIGTFAPMRYRKTEAKHILDITEAKYLICSMEYAGFNYLEMSDELFQECPSLKRRILFGKDVPEGEHSLLNMLDNPLEKKYEKDYLAQFRPSPDDITTLCSTTGTEALPKIVPRTINNWKGATRGLLKGTGHTADSVYSGPFPYMNMGGLGVELYPWIMAGGKMVTHDPINIDIFMEQITTEKVNYIIAVPAIFLAMLYHPELDKKYDISSFTVVGCGGEPPPHNVIEEFDKRGITVINQFGATEGWGFFTLPTQSVEERKETFRPDEIRKISLGQEFKLTDPATGKEVPLGVDGELIVKGPGVMAGYLKADDVNKRSFTSDGYFKTGDLACRYEDNIMKYVGRVKDMIIRSGQNISPSEVEMILNYHPKIAEVAIIGEPDDVRGQNVCAYVVEQPGETITLEEIDKFMREKQVASFKIPRRLEILDALPKGPSGKVLKRDLREDLAKKMEKKTN